MAAQHSLEKLILDIHSIDGDIKLIHEVMLKLQPAPCKGLLSKDSAFSILTAVIEAAKHLESVQHMSQEQQNPVETSKFFAAQSSQRS